MLDDILAGIPIGLVVFYLVHTLVEADGWVTVNWLLRLAHPDRDTTEDVIGDVGMQHPRLAHWMGCQWCMTPWWSALFTLLFHPAWLTWLTAIGVAATVIRRFEK